jgi:hypothetical protein
MAACFGVLLLVSLEVPALAQPQTRSRRKARRIGVPLKRRSDKM